MAMTSKAKSHQRSIEQVDKLIVTGSEYVGTNFTSAYIDAVFTIWYSMGKPSASRLRKRLPDPAEFGIPTGYPSENTLVEWRDHHFLERAAQLDEEVSRQLSERLISEKVAMLNAHAAVASEMQQMALDFLHANPDKLNAMVALRMLVEGVRIERESVGIPRSLEKLSEKSDDDLLKQIEDMLLRTPPTFEQLEDGE